MHRIEQCGEETYYLSAVARIHTQFSVKSIFDNVLLDLLLHMSAISLWTDLSLFTGSLVVQLHRTMPL